MPTQLVANVLHEALLASGVFCDVVSPHRSSICFPQTADLVLHWDALFLSIYLTWRLYKVCVCLAHVSRIPLYLPVSDVSYSYFQPCWSAERHLADVCGTWLVRPSAQLFTDGPIATVLEAGWAAESTIMNHVERVKSHLEMGRNILEHLGHAMYDIEGVEPNLELSTLLPPLPNEQFYVSTDERDPDAMEVIRQEGGVFLSDLLTMKDWCKYS